MTRFNLGYGIGESLTPDDLKKINFKKKEIKIKDSKEELPDLIVKDIEVARKYIEYMNRPVDVREIDVLISDILYNLKKLNELNDELIKPAREVVGVDEDEEPIYKTPIKEDLYYFGYVTRRNNFTERIQEQLNQMKEQLLK